METPESRQPQARTASDPGKLFGEGGGQKGSGRVLVVAADEAVRKTLAFLAAADGCEVMAETYGREAEAAVVAWDPAVILLDVDGLGVQPSQAVVPYRSAASPETPIILLSYTAITAEHVSEIGAAAFLRKPFQVTDLLNLLDRFADCC